MLTVVRRLVRLAMTSLIQWMWSNFRVRAVRNAGFDGSEHHTVSTTNTNSVGEKCRRRLRKVRELRVVLARNLDNARESVSQTQLKVSTAG